MKKIAYHIWKGFNDLIKNISFDYIDITLDLLSIDGTPDINFNTAGFIFNLKQFDIRDFLTELYLAYYSTATIKEKEK